MAFTLLSPSAALSGPGVFTKSTPYRIQFALDDTSGGGGSLTVSAKGEGSNTALAALVGTQTFYALPILALFKRAATTIAAAATIMQDVEVNSRVITGAGASSPLQYNWNANVAGVLFPILDFTAPNSGVAAVWAVTIELRHSIIG